MDCLYLSFLIGAVLGEITERDFDLLDGDGEGEEEGEGGDDF